MLAPGEVSNERRYLIIDSSCFLLLTPLGIASSWLCIQGAQIYYNTNHFWTGFGLVLLTGFLLMMYLLWIVITARYHYLTFKKWQMENMTVRLVFSNHQAHARSDGKCEVDIDHEVVVSVLGNDSKTTGEYTVQNRDSVEQGACLFIQNCKVNNSKVCESIV